MEAEELPVLCDDICLESMVVVSIKEELDSEISALEGRKCFDISGTEDTEEYIEEYIELKAMEGNRSV
jgi:hypothetical protein